MEYEWWNHPAGTQDGGGEAGGSSSHAGSSSQDTLMGGGSGEGQGMTRDGDSHGQSSSWDGIDGRECRGTKGSTDTQLMAGILTVAPSDGGGLPRCA